MKKTLIIFITAILFLGIVACDGNSQNPDEQGAILEKIDELTNKQKELQGLIDDLSDDLDSYKNQDSLQLEKINELTNKLSSLIDEVNSLQSEKDENTQIVNQLKAEIETLQETLARLTEELNQHIAGTTFLVDFIQVDETLFGKISFEVPQVLSGGEEFSKLIITVVHELSATYDSTYAPIKYYNDSNVGEIEVEVEFHGKYKLEIELIYSGTKLTHHIRLADREISFSASHYNMTWLHATMPVLLFASNLLSNDLKDGPTYVEIERANTFDFNKLPEGSYKYPVFASAAQGNYEQGQIPNFFDKVTFGSAQEVTLKWWSELFSIDSSSTFTILVADNVLTAAYGAIMSEIPFENLEFVIYTDGSFTTSMINSTFNDLESFDTIYNEFQSWLNGNLDGTGLNGHFKSEFALVASKLSNFTYIVNDIDSWIFDSELMEYVKNELNVKVLTVEEAFLNVRNSNSLMELEYLLKTRWGDGTEESMSMYFDKNDNDNLLILGTSPAGEGNSNYATFEKYLEFINVTYGDQYDIFYKGHPRYPSDEDRIQLFEGYNIVELPNSIPVETLMLLYPDVYVGGYTGTSFQSSKTDQTIFFFGPQSLIEGNATLKIMIENGIFNNTKFLTKDDDGNVISVDKV